MSHLSVTDLAPLYRLLTIAPLVAPRELLAVTRR